MSQGLCIPGLCDKAGRAHGRPRRCEPCGEAAGLASGQRLLGLCGSVDAVGFENLPPCRETILNRDSYPVPALHFPLEFMF